MNERRMSPILKSSLSILEHSMEHLAKKTLKDSKFAVLHADNAVELILKETVRFHKMRIINQKGITINYYECIDKLLGKGIQLTELADLDLLHTERNSIYHQGTTPDIDKAEWLVYDVALIFIQRLCNDELNYNIMNYSDLFRVSIDMKTEIEVTKKGMLNKYINDVKIAINENLFEAAILLSYSGIDIALRGQIRNSISKDVRSTSELFKIIAKNKILPKNLADRFRVLYYQRNQIAHGGINASEIEAKIALNLFEDVIKNVSEKDISDYEEERGIFDFIKDGYKSIENMTGYLYNITNSLTDCTKEIGNQTKIMLDAQKSGKSTKSSTINNVIKNVSNSLNDLSDVININQNKYHDALLKFDDNYSNYLDNLNMLDNINDEDLIKFRGVITSLQNSCQQALEGIERGRKGIVQLKGYSRELNVSIKNLLINYDELNIDFKRTMFILKKLIQKINEILKSL